MLLNHITRLSFTLALLISLPTWSAEEINQRAQNSHPQNTNEAQIYGALELIDPAEQAENLRLQGLGVLAPTIQEITEGLRLIALGGGLAGGATVSQLTEALRLKALGGSLASGVNEVQLTEALRLKALSCGLADGVDEFQLSEALRLSEERATLENIRFESEKLNSLIYPSEVCSPTVDVDAMVQQLRERIDNSLKPMKEQENKFLQLTTPWAQTLNYHLENGSLTQEILDQIKTDATEKGYILNISDFEKIVQNQELERKDLKLEQENFRNTLEARLVEHYENGTLTQQVLDAIREEGKSLGVPIVLQGLPDGLY